MRAVKLLNVIPGRLHPTDLQFTATEAMIRVSHSNPRDIVELAAESKNPRQKALRGADNVTQFSLSPAVGGPAAL